MIHLLVNSTFLTVIFLSPSLAYGDPPSCTVESVFPNPKYGCSTCHGDEGRGDGADELAYAPAFRARDFTKGKFKVSICDSGLRGVIENGGAAYGLSSRMEPHPAKYCDPDPDNGCIDGYTTEDYDCLIKIIRELAQ